MPERYYFYIICITLDNSYRLHKSKNEYALVETHNISSHKEKVNEDESSGQVFELEMLDSGLLVVDWECCVEERGHCFPKEEHAANEAYLKFVLTY